MIKEVKTDEKVDGLRLYIMELDPLRLPMKFGYILIVGVRILNFFLRIRREVRLN